MYQSVRVDDSEERLQLPRLLLRSGTAYIDYSLLQLDNLTGEYERIYGRHHIRTTVSRDLTDDNKRSLQG